MHGLAARLFTLLAMTAAMTGCAGSRGPDVITITGSEYDLAFSSAVAAVRDAGMPAVLVDRRSGILETEYRDAGTALEPWRPDNSSASAAVESTINHERRKARIEFAPVRFAGTPGAEQPLTGPDLVGEQMQVVDLTTFEGRIEIRAWVQLERSTVVGRRRGTWSRRSTTMAIDPDSGLGPSQTFWTPVARDEALERKLLRTIEQSMHEGAGGSSDNATETQTNGEAAQNPA